MAAQLVEHILQLRAGVAADHDGAVAVLGVDAVDLLRDHLAGLVPGDALPFVLAAQFAVDVIAAAGLPVHALQGVLDAVGAEQVLALRAAARTGALLRQLEGVVVGIVGFHAHHHAIHRVGAQHAAAAAAVVPAGHGYPLAVQVRIELRV